MTADGPTSSGRLGMAAMLLVILAAFAVYLIGNGAVPLWDRDEPRYAQCSRQMLQSGDWVVPRLYDQVRTAKPPLIYWCQAAAMTVLGDNAFAARLPSAVAMFMTLLVVGFTIRRHVSPEHAFWTVLVLATSVLTLITAKASMTDSVLLLWITIAQLCLFAMCQGRGGWPVVLMLGAAIGLAGLTKGPVVLGMQAATLVAFGLLSLVVWLLSRYPGGGREGVCPEPATLPKTPTPPSPGVPGEGVTHHNESRVARENGIGWKRRWAVRLAKTAVAILVVATIVLPWIFLVDHRSPGFIRTALHHEVGERATEALEGHKGPPGYYLAMIWPVFLPWSLILPLAMVSAWQRLHLTHVRFALAAVLGPWLMLEIVRTKLPHYLLPCFPPLAFLASDALVQSFRGRDALAGRAFLIASGIWAGLIILLGTTPWIAAKWFTPLPWAAMTVITLAAVSYSAVVVASLARHRPERAMLLAGGGMLAIGVLLFGLFLPRLDFLRLSIRTADTLKQNQVTAPGQVVMLDYKEPSLAFYQGGTIREDRATVITNKLLDSHPAWLVITQTMWDKADPAVRDRLTVVGRSRGLNVADGMRIEEVLVVKHRTDIAEASGR